MGRRLCSRGEAEVGMILRFLDVMKKKQVEDER